ncbi:DUF1223 domain-containing protein [Paraburkholderia sp.]|jgi:hypothetical protein|uniref:DUF1223 domain-containing protein n=1 Tax=Paraburkholderia sp. TaxID=1926495 RepID=UPI002F41415B
MSFFSRRFADLPVVRAVALLAALATSGVAQAASSMCTAHSPAHRVALVELYSSEGCNSCPPADRWLGQWKDRGGAQGIVPLALHVDYWNSLGWTDRFSQHRFTERQQTLTDLAGAHTIYTPEVFVSGRELRGWSQAESFEGRVQQVTAQPAQADVALELTAPATQGANGFGVAARFTSRVDAGEPLSAYLAVYENALSSEVRAGENRGATLHHERVVRQWIGPVPLTAGNAQIHREIMLDDADGNAAMASGKYGVVGFVENAATGEVLQVADLAACR